MRNTIAALITLTLTVCLAGLALAVEPGRASGTVTVDGKATPLAFAASYRKEGLFDEAKQDTMVVLTDKALGDAVATDDWELGQRARRGELVVLTLRIDGTKLVNVGVNHRGIEGTAVLPGQWFEYKPGKAAPGLTAASMTLGKREADGHTYACAVELVAAPAAPVRVAEPDVPEQAAPTPTLPPATTSTIAPETLTPLLIKAMMAKDEEQALKLIKLGVNPNARDQYGVPVLNWAVMMCMPRTVKALVGLKADLNYQRAPGLTIMQEAGACPEAAKILRAAGAK
ncbi:MAG TPA: ankyrin repeat domain-containing protein [Thermoanaerobaculaceae bacterium]|nr:ankyrin repeat domain-containing protein [Thermoanaerobaculaceae bacterium]HPS77769.1 ankyrin repeat domain-containing protein [Thermoanaerobaculaceae bacterium]